MWCFAPMPVFSEISYEEAVANLRTASQKSPHTVPTPDIQLNLA